MQVRLRPREQLEREARAFAATHLKAAPEPKIINVEAVLAFEAPRAFQWGGVGYRAPPLSYQAGVRLQVAANALEELRTKEAPDSFTRPACRTAVRLLTQSIHPTRWWRRLLVWRAPFFRNDPAEIEALLRWLLSVPDDAHYPIPQGPAITVDVMDHRMAFAREFPSLIDATGNPRSWAAYQYGLRHLSRLHARRDLATGTAVRFAGAIEESWKTWRTERLAAAGF